MFANLINITGVVYTVFLLLLIYNNKNDKVNKLLKWVLATNMIKSMIKHIDFIFDDIIRGGIFILVFLITMHYIKDPKKVKDKINNNENITLFSQTSFIMGSYVSITKIIIENNLQKYINDEIAKNILKNDNLNKVIISTIILFVFIFFINIIAYEKYKELKKQNEKLVIVKVITNFKDFIVLSIVFACYVFSFLLKLYDISLVYIGYIAYTLVKKIINKQHKKVISNDKLLISIGMFDFYYNGDFKIDKVKYNNFKNKINNLFVWEIVLG